MRKVAVYTLGCKVNQYETQAIKEGFKKNGYEIVHENQKADVYVINTCTVTHLSDRKSRQFIRRAKRINPDSIVVVTGCYAQVSPEEIEAIDDVNLIVGTNEKNHIVEYVNELDQKHQIKKVKAYPEIIDYENMNITEMDTRTRAYIKIQEGCNQFCSYCIIPYARGNIRSRPMEDIIEEAKILVKNGYKEIVLTGINAALYGKDLKQHSLLDVVESINAIDGKFRIRLSSIEPAVIDDDFMDKFVSFKKLCSHIHLSLQSGSNRILKLMNRKYTSERYAKIAKKLKDRKEDINITTDIIVGFPGETDENFEETCSFVKQLEFGKVHVFKYSKRKGTKAAEMKDQVDAKIKNYRSDVLISLCEKAAKDFQKKFIGRTQEVLFEVYNETTGFYEGYTDNYIKVYCKKDMSLLDEFAEVQIIEMYEDGFIGKII